jgi:hypothetical protein
MLHIFISTGQIRNIVGNILTLFLLVGLFCGVVYGWLWVTKNSCERNLCVPDSLNIVTLALAGSLLNPWRKKLKEPVFLFNEIYKYKAMQWLLRVL